MELKIKRTRQNHLPQEADKSEREIEREVTDQAYSTSTLNDWRKRTNQQKKLRKTALAGVAY